jgi:UTP--glucose-1-phosphate uridylyltransferase
VPSVGDGESQRVKGEVRRRGISLGFHEKLKTATGCVDQTCVMPVRKVVIPAAGLGTRFLPATKAQPKEMLPLIDRPAIQYVVEEAVSAGLNDVLVVTGRSKRSIEDHFDRSVELEQSLILGNKIEELTQVQNIAKLANMHYVRQPEARGLGHAIGYAKYHVGDEPFVVMLGDDIMVDDTVLKRMLAVYETHGCSVVALKRFPKSQISSYGCVAIDASAVGLGAGVVKITKLVEKPPADEAPSDLAIMGRYLFTPEIFEKIAITPPGRGNEIQITDSMTLLLEDQPIMGVVFEDGRYDIGNKLDFLRATVELAVDRADLGAEFLGYLKDFVSQH